MAKGIHLSTRQAILLIAILLAFIVMNVAGCSVDDSTLRQRAQTAASIADTAKHRFADAQAELAALKSRAATMPAGAERQSIEKAVATQEKIVATAADAVQQADAAVAKAKALIDAASSDDPNKLAAAAGGALAGTPLAVWAPLATLVVGLGASVVQTIRKSREAKENAAALQETNEHLANVVKSLEVAGPNWTEKDKEAIAAVQGPETTAKVHDVKQSLGL